MKKKKISDFIPDIVNDYYIDEYGEVYRGDKKLSTYTKRRYNIIRILDSTGNRRTFRNHRLVAICFLEDTPEDYENYEVNHIDGNKKNNHYSNLEWCTHKQNMEHASRENLIKSGKENHRYGKHLSEETKNKISNATKGSKNGNSSKIVQLDLNGNLIKIFDCIKDASIETGSSYSSISKCVRNVMKSTNGFKWKYYNDYKNNNEL